MRYSLIIFDLDGTLADSFPWFLGSLNSVADAFRLRRVAGDEIEPLRRADVPEILKHLGVPRWKLPMIARYMRQLKSTQLDTIRLFPGVDPMLRTLKAGGITIALVSSDNEENAKVVLGKENAALFSDYNCSAALFGKAGKFRRVMRRARVRARTSPRDRRRSPRPRSRACRRHRLRGRKVGLYRTREAPRSQAGSGVRANGGDK